MTHNFNEITGEGIVHANGTIGLICRNPLPIEDVPDLSAVYILHHPRHKRNVWILENINELDDLPQPSDNYYATPNDIPDIAFVYFSIQPAFDYIAFQDGDDIYIEWNDEYTMQYIIEQSEEMEE